MPILSKYAQQERDKEIAQALSLAIYTQKEIMEQFHCSEYTVSRIAHKIGAEFTQKSGKPKQEVHYDIDKVRDMNKYHPCAVLKKDWLICYHGDKCYSSYKCEAAQKVI